MKKLSKTEAELKKSVVYKKTCISFLIITQMYTNVFNIKNLKKELCIIKSFIDKIKFALTVIFCMCSQKQ